MRRYRNTIKLNEGSSSCPLVWSLVIESKAIKMHWIVRTKGDFKLSVQPASRPSMAQRLLAADKICQQQ